MEIIKTGYTGKVSAMGVSLSVDVVEISGKTVLHKKEDALDKECFYVVVNDRDVLESVLNILNMVQ